MNKELVMLFSKMTEDEEFAEKILVQTESEKIIGIAREEGIEITEDNVIEFNGIMKSVMSEFLEGELSDESLESVSGGSLLGNVKTFAGGVKTVMSIIGIKTGDEVQYYKTGEAPSSVPFTASYKGKL